MKGKRREDFFDAGGTPEMWRGKSQTFESDKDKNNNREMNKKKKIEEETDD